MKQAGWMMVFAVALLQALSGVMLMLGDTPTTFEGDTGVSWAEISDAYPTVATQFAIANQAALTGAAVVGSFSVLVSLFGLRTGQKWAWFAMWLMPLYMLPGILGLLGTDNQQAFGYMGLAFIAITAVSLLLSIPSIFKAPAQPET